MGWYNSHLYKFTIGDRTITDEETIEESLDKDCLDSAKTKFNKFIDLKTKNIVYLQFW